MIFLPTMIYLKMRYNNEYCPSLLLSPDINLPIIELNLSFCFCRIKYIYAQVNILNLLNFFQL